MAAPGEPERKSLPANIFRRGPSFDANALLATPDACETQRRRLESNYSALTSRDKDACTFAYEESKAAYDLARDRFKSLDGKGVTFAGVVTTGLGAVSVLGDSGKEPDHGIWFTVALVAFAISMLCAIFSLAPRGVNAPDLSTYVWPKTLANEDNLVRVQVDLSRAWLRDTVALDHANHLKAARLKLATLLLAAGLLSLVANFVFAREKPVPTLRVIVAPSPVSSTGP